MVGAIKWKNICMSCVKCENYRRHYIVMSGVQQFGCCTPDTHLYQLCCKIAIDVGHFLAIWIISYLLVVDIYFKYMITYQLLYIKPLGMIIHIPGQECNILQ